MKRLMDIHTHAVASGHAYSTVDENLRWAAEQGLQLVALTDHAPCHEGYHLSCLFCKSARFAQGAAWSAAFEGD